MEFRQKKKGKITITRNPFLTVMGETKERLGRRFLQVKIFTKLPANDRYRATWEQWRILVGQLAKLQHFAHVFFQNIIHQGHFAQTTREHETQAARQAFLVVAHDGEQVIRRPALRSCGKTKAR